MEKVKIKIPCNPKYLLTVRLATSSFASILDFDLEAVEDLKVSISEVVNYIIPYNEEEVKIEYYLFEDKMEIKVEADKDIFEHYVLTEELKLKRQILLCLTDDIRTEGNSITIVKNK